MPKFLVKWSYSGEREIEATDEDEVTSIWEEIIDNSKYEEFSMNIDPVLTEQDLIDAEKFESIVKKYRKAADKYYQDCKLIPDTDDLAGCILDFADELGERDGNDDRALDVIKMILMGYFKPTPKTKKNPVLKTVKLNIVGGVLDIESVAKGVVVEVAEKDNKVNFKAVGVTDGGKFETVDHKSTVDVCPICSDVFNVEDGWNDQDNNLYCSDKCHRARLLLNKDHLQKLIDDKPKF